MPSATGIPGLLTLEPARHAVVLAVHAWAHVPLSRLGRLIDVAAVSQGVDRSETAAIARAWDVERLWRVTQATIDSLLGQEPRPFAGRIWARHLWSVRERTVLERHLERWLGPFSMLPPVRCGQGHRPLARPAVHARRGRDAGADDSPFDPCGDGCAQAPVRPRQGDRGDTA